MLKLLKALQAKCVAMMPSELTNTIELFIVYVDRNEAHFIYIYVYHTNVFEADNIYKNPPPNVISPIFAIFPLWGSTHNPADWWSAHRSLAACDSFKRSVHDWCNTNWIQGGGIVWVPPAPNKNPGFAGAVHLKLLRFSPIFVVSK